MEDLQHVKKDRAKTKRKFTDSVKNFEAVIEQDTKDLETVDLFYKKMLQQYVAITVVHERLIEVLMDADPECDTSEHDEYMESVRTTFLTKMKQMDEFKEELQQLQEKRERERMAVEQTVQATTGNVLVDVSANLEAQRSLCAQMAEDLGALGTAQTSAMRDITQQLADRLEIKPGKPGLKLEGIKVPVWNGDKREFFGWK